MEKDPTLSLSLSLSLILFLNNTAKSVKIGCIPLFIKGTAQNYV